MSKLVGLVLIVMGGFTGCVGAAPPLGVGTILIGVFLAIVGLGVTWRAEGSK